MSSIGQSSKVFWIHCNLCYINYVQKEQKLYILSCYHVICEKCGRPTAQEKVECPICKNIFGRRLICNDLHPKLKELFHPRPWMLTFPKAYPVVKFQTKQRDHFMLGCRKMVEYNETLEKERNRLRDVCREAYLAKKRIATERQQLEALLRKLIHDQRKVPQRIDISTDDDTIRSIELPRIPKQDRRVIHSTYHAPENDYTFDFPNESHFSKSFVL